MKEPQMQVCTVQWRLDLARIPLQLIAALWKSNGGQDAKCVQYGVWPTMPSVRFFWRPSRNVLSISWLELFNKEERLPFTISPSLRCSLLTFMNFFIRLQCVSEPFGAVLVMTVSHSGRQPGGWGRGGGGGDVCACRL